MTAIAGYSIIDGYAPYYEDDGSNYTYFRTERRCPECYRAMVTNGEGDFVCPECRYTDWQDVSRYYAAGLDYAVPASGKGRIGVFGKRNMRKHWHFK